MGSNHWPLPCEGEYGDYDARLSLGKRATDGLEMAGIGGKLHQICTGSLSRADCLENEMDVWLIEKKDPGMGDPWRYDCYYAHVIRAESEDDARRIASTVACDEGPSVWLDPSMTTCKPLTSAGEPGIILSDFLAG